MEEQLLDNSLSEAVEIRPNAERANQLIIILAISFVINLVSGVSSYMQIQLLNDFQSGLNPSDAAIESNDNRELFVGIIAIIIRIAAIILFIRWFRRAYFNTGLRETTEFTEGWAAGAWFVPILNLFRPYQIMKEIWNSSAKNSNTPRSESIIGFWWFLWVVTSVLGNIGGRMARNAEEIETLLSSTYFTLAIIILAIPLSIVTIVMIKQHTEMESSGF